MPAVDEEFEQRYQALQAADREWREHQMTGWDCWSRARWEVGRSTHPLTPERRKQEELLRARFEAARAAWLSCISTIPDR